jgi:hypothetical protein
MLGWGTPSAIGDYGGGTFLVEYTTPNKQTADPSCHRYLRTPSGSVGPQIVKVTAIGLEPITSRLKV